MISAEISLWIYVGFGVCRVTENGVNGISSFMLTGCMSLTLLAVVCYFVSNVCKMNSNQPKTTKEARNNDN